uniref:Protease subunit of ATP-dependent protease n=1 Tax=uncultured marine virus TaxID=186617 RepID=A0A0F7L933_9VIRU|nr:protease subunit of ATP-dependent protease [uncultured marine virus]
MRRSGDRRERLVDGASRRRRILRTTESDRTASPRRAVGHHQRTTDRPISRRQFARRRTTRRTHGFRTLAIRSRGR